MGLGDGQTKVAPNLARAENGGMHVHVSLPVQQSLDDELGLEGIVPGLVKRLQFERISPATRSCRELGGHFGRPENLDQVLWIAFVQTGWPVDVQLGEVADHSRPGQVQRDDLGFQIQCDRPLSETWTISGSVWFRTVSDGLFVDRKAPRDRFSANATNQCAERQAEGERD